MSGIINYFHGESGDVAGRWWQLLDVKLAFTIELAGNPHRAVARDYGSDIGIDPLIEMGHRVVYLRVDDTCGIWVREGDEHGSNLRAALDRVLGNRQWMGKWASHSHDPAEAVQVAQEFFEATGEPIQVGFGEPAHENPATPVSFFLSHSSRNTLLARQLHEDLRTDAKATVWFDLAQARDTRRTREEAISRWLKESVESCKGFILLLTRSALESRWVQEEIGFALEQQRQHPGFQILILKTDDSPVPDFVKSAGKIIDCDRIWWSRGINEELFAAIYSREGRRAWLAHEHGRDAAEGKVLTYQDFATDAGSVLNFSWNTSPAAAASWYENDLSWSLEYKRDGGDPIRVEGGGSDQPADLDMKPGDRIGFIIVRRRWGVEVLAGLPLWMRRDDLTVTSDAVLDRYYTALSRKHTRAEETPTVTVAEEPGKKAFELSLQLVRAGLGLPVFYGKPGG